MAVVSGVFLGSVWAGENRAVISNFKRQNPTAFVIAVMAVSYIVISMLGSVMVFMSAITLPLACKFKNTMTGKFYDTGEIFAITQIKCIPLRYEFWQKHTGWLNLIS